MVLWYLGVYLILSMVMIMMLFVSGDFKKDLSVCPQQMLAAYLVLSLTPCTNFVIAYLNFRHVTKTYQPLVTEYIYSKQTIKVKMITFRGLTPKILLGILDLLHFLAA